MIIMGEKKYKGIYIYKCINESIEEIILYLFQEKLRILPIAQNILICSNETSIEEIQSFLYRAILCDYYTLFIIELPESFSKFQQNKMYSYIDKLLSYKLEKFKNGDRKNKNIEKLNTREYLNSCIYFLYKNIEYQDGFIYELEKYMIKEKKALVKVEADGKKDEKLSNFDDLNISDIPNMSDGWDMSNIFIRENTKLKNIKVFSSDICGLGKSFKIKTIIKKNNEIYYHFPLGGKLTKNIIYEKTLELLKKINQDAIKSEWGNIKNKKEEDYKMNFNYEHVAIHLDLMETEETSLINEFLLSFLITKFYTNNGNIIYIPSVFKIYVEIPNGFDNYLSKIGILKVFKIENITLGNLPKLDLDYETKMIFNIMIGKETNEQIEEFIKENIGIQKYTYHQVHIFISIFISQFKSNNINSKLILGEDVTNKCVKYFVESTKYFTNGGFANIIINKNENIKDKIDLCLNAYKNDLSNINFKHPLIFIDKKTLTFKLETLNFEDEEEKEDIKINKEADIVYLIDATGLMGRQINSVNDYAIEIVDKLKKNYKEFKFCFGVAFYRDKLDSPKDKNEYIPLTDNIEDLKKKISKIEPYGGGDKPNDWVEGYNLALNKMNWRNGIKLIIHITNSGAHGQEFSREDKYPEEGPKLTNLIEECAKKNINIIGFKIGDDANQSFRKICEIYNDFIISNNDKRQFIGIYDFEKWLNPKKEEIDPILEKFHEFSINAINPSYKFLKRLKNMLSIPNNIEKDEGDKKSLLSILNLDTDNFVITEDNYKKMILVFYRIKANIPLIIMGETGCGKTSLIIKLNQLLNNGEKLVKIINIHPGINDKEICNKMKEMNEKAKLQDYINKEKNIRKELWVFFDEINTCLSFSILTEIFINRTFNGEKLEDNIRLIGACNPYRRRELTEGKYGITREDDKEDELVYNVQLLPQSLLFFVSSFGSIKDEDEKKYINSIIQKLFNKEEEHLHRLTTEAISKCHIFLRKYYKDPSIISLREIARFTKCVEFFHDYFLKKNNLNKSQIDDDTKKLNKIKSIINSIYLCYYIRLNKDEIRGLFEAELQKNFLKIINIYSEEENDEENATNLIDKIKNKKLKEEFIDKNIDYFSDLLRIEEEFLLKQIKLDKGIGQNQLLKENLFLSFLSIVTKIPLIIVGKPGTGKSLSIQLLYNSMRGVYSENEFFRKYPQIIQIFFQGSESTTPEDIIELFKSAENLYENFKKNKNKGEIVPIYMILFEELGLAEKSITNPLKVLHSKLEYDGRSEGICFIGTSNYYLDAAKVNRAISLTVPNLEDRLFELQYTAKNIVRSISEDITKDYSKMIIFNILSRSYYLYKQYLNFIKKLTVLKIYFKTELKGKDLKEIEVQQEYKKLLKQEKKIKTEFHGNRDFYNLIKGVGLEGSKLNNISDEVQIVPIIEKYIERNFGGITYEIDIDFNLEIDDIKGEMKILRKILKEKILKKSEDEILKVTSVYLYKKIYNEACIFYKTDNMKGIIYQIEDDNIDKYNLNQCILDNINDNNSRYLLLEIKTTLSTLITQIIKAQNNDMIKKDIHFCYGSPFSDDDNIEYKLQKVSEIQNYSSKPDNLIILQNLNSIQPYLYDLYNMNYKIVDEKKFASICLDNFSQVLTPVNDSFRIITLVDRKFVNSVDIAFLNRLEKMEISFIDLLNNNQKRLIMKILNEIRMKEVIKKAQSNINYDLNHLLINCNKEEIGGLVYYLSLENKKEKIDEDFIKEQIYSKISKMLPQDIIVNLPKESPLKYFSERKYNNFLEYLDLLESNREDNINNYKISIIYTFSNIISYVEGPDKINHLYISEIQTENQLKSYIDDIKSINKYGKNNYIISIHFEQYNSDKIQFISSYINNYCKDDCYNYIFIIHIQRSFENEKKKEKIYSIPNIYDNINQLFIDNLQGAKTSLKDILEKNIKEVMFNMEIFKNLDIEFIDSLINFVYDSIDEKSKNETNLLFGKFYDEKVEKNRLNEEKYKEDILIYMSNDLEFKNGLIKKAKELIEIDDDVQGSCLNIINKMFKLKLINKNSIDLITCLFDYIKENLFKKNLLFIFNVLEDNNFLTTLIEINKDRNIKLDKNDKNGIIINELKSKFLNEIKVDKGKIYKPKFLFCYKVPGFYNFYKILSDYLNKNISKDYFNIEKKLRNDSINESKNIKILFHEKEKELLNKTFEKIKQNILYFDLINKISPDLILKDYIIFYVEKYIGNYFESFSKLIELLLNIRFPEDMEIIKENIFNQIQITILKIMWLESNIIFIENILKIFYISKDIVNSQDEFELFNSVCNLIYDKEEPILFKVDGKNNLIFRKEVNECFYLLISGLCLNVVSKDIKSIKIDIKDYYYKLGDINKILQNLTHNLNLYINESYIISELLKIIEYQLYKGQNNIDYIEDIRKKLIQNSKILRKNRPDKTTDLIKNFLDLNQKLKEEKNEEFKNKYFDMLKYIYIQEIKKVKDIDYRASLLSELMKEKEIIKISNDIFQLLLKIYIDKNYFNETKDLLLKNKGDLIIKLIDKYLSNLKTDYYLALSETIIYFFEKNSLIYLKYILNIKNESLDSEPLNIFKECIEFLCDLKKDASKFHNNLVNITKIFCLGYIKSYCYIFIKMHDKPEFKPDNIIAIINEYDKIKMVKLYIYKIIFNQNDKQILNFLNENIKYKYKLEKYDNYIKFREEELNYYNIYEISDNDSDNYKYIYQILSENQKDIFKKEIKKEDIITNGELKFDAFFMAANRLILSKLKLKDFEDNDIYINFYNNVCEPLFKSDFKEESNKLLILIQFFFERNKFKEIKNYYEICQKDIEVLLYGYRYCLNEISENNSNNKEYIYKYLYDINNLEYLEEKYYPGSDTNEEPYFKLYNKIENHRENGLNIIDKNYLTKDNKKIRNLSQISYRLLNYILYSHLFFAKLFTNSEQFDNYLPKGMTWFNTIKECFILLKKELENKGIKYVEIFMDFIFKDLFEKLHKQECINNYEDLIKFENELEILIQENLNKLKIKIEKYKEIEEKYINDEKSGIALLKEIYNKDKYDHKNYPYYEHFYYTDYLDEEYINKILLGKNKNEFPILRKYLEYKKQKKISDKYPLDKLIIFNKVLNLFNDKYSNQISREKAEKTIIKDSNIYENPEYKKLIDEFIELFNSFKEKEEGKNEIIKLDINKNCLCDFLLVDDNKYGKSYKRIYRNFIKKQNEELKKLFEKKTEKLIFNDDYINSINVQQIKEDEIFTFNLPKKFNFFEVICNSSYRKVIDTQDYKDYNEYKINLNSIESKMTDLLLKNKKLLNNEIIGFNFNNEIFSYEINDSIYNFKYGDKKISIEDKVIFYNYIMENNGNNEKYKIIINNFITLIEYLNKIKQYENSAINEYTKIYEIEIVKYHKNISKEFLDIFMNQNNLVVNKIPNMFDCYLKLIFKYIKDDIEKYQEKIEINKKEVNIIEYAKENKEKEEQKYYIDEKILQKIDKIFEDKDMIIQKETLATAIRLFISLILYREKEKDKDKKIKSNRKNIVEYLKSKDLWEERIYNDSRFEENLEKIKELNIKINKILWLYYYLMKDKNEDFEKDILEYIKELEEDKERIRNEKKEREREEKEEMYFLNQTRRRPPFLDTTYDIKDNSDDDYEDSIFNFEEDNSDDIRSRLIKRRKTSDDNSFSD